MRTKFVIPKTASFLSGVLLIAAIGILALLLVYPVRNQISRLGIVGAFTTADMALMLLLHRRKKALVFVLAPQIVLVMFLILPGRDHNPSSLRARYLASLQRFMGTRYVWGGETHLGVDCSGLLRASLIEACFTESFHTGNPRLLRQGLWLWWNDASASEISRGYRGLTRNVAGAARLDALPLLEPGDFAVTTDGSHILAHLGQNQWIEAEPSKLVVTRFTPNDSPDRWNLEVVAGRWKCMETRP